jgi:DNA-binding NarL/FixJ family response regulator
VAEQLDYLDGPRFCEWVRERHPNLNLRLELGETLARRWQNWEGGAAAHYNSADKVLTRLGQVYSLERVPDDLWVPDPHTNGTKRGRLTEAERQGIRQMYANGRSYTEIAERFNVCRKTARTVVLA